MDGVGLVASAARSAYAELDETLKRSLIFGGGSMAASMMAILLLPASVIFTMLLVPAAIALGIIGMNAGREQQNRTGFYLATVGFVASNIMLYGSMIMYMIASTAASMASSAASGMFSKIM